MLTTGAHV
jgi:antiviral helicase SKI2